MQRNYKRLEDADFLRYIDKLCKNLKSYIKDNISKISTAIFFS